ncbi:hypothetical protein NMY22_g7979 [Coprinellus aureogranulatus]|nr:hypothetical protein NMY22_g7979 [Coprinellus aureogranulatus]
MDPSMPLSKDAPASGVQANQQVHLPTTLLSASTSASGAPVQGPRTPVRRRPYDEVEEARRKYARELLELTPNTKVLRDAFGISDSDTFTPEAKREMAKYFNFSPATTPIKPKCNLANHSISETDRVSASSADNGPMHSSKLDPRVLGTVSNTIGDTNTTSEHNRLITEATETNNTSATVVDTPTEEDKENVEEFTVIPKESHGAVPVASGVTKSTSAALKSARKRTLSNTDEGDAEKKKIRRGDASLQGVEESTTPDSGNPRACRTDVPLPSGAALEVGQDTPDVEPPVEASRAVASNSSDKEDAAPSSKDKGKARAHDEYHYEDGGEADGSQTVPATLPAPVPTPSAYSTGNQHGTALNQAATPDAGFLVRTSFASSFLAECRSADKAFMQQQIANYVPKASSNKSACAPQAGMMSEFQAYPQPSVPSTSYAVAAPNVLLPQAAPSSYVPAAVPVNSQAPLGSQTVVPGDTIRCAMGTYKEAYNEYRYPKACNVVFPATKDGVKNHLAYHRFEVQFEPRHGPKVKCPWVGYFTFPMVSGDLAIHVWNDHVRNGAKRKVCSHHDCTSTMFHGVGKQAYCNECTHEGLF